MDFLPRNKRETRLGNIVAPLRKIILEQGEKRGTEESKKAIAFCQKCIAEYEEWFDWNESRWLRWQQIAIIGGVVATLAGVITMPEDWLKEHTYLA